MEKSNGEYSHLSVIVICKTKEEEKYLFVLFASFPSETCANYEGYINRSILQVIQCTVVKCLQFDAER